METSQVMAHARFVCNILNEQLVPAIVAKNYGRLSGLPLPEIMVSVPEAAQSKDKIDFYDGVITRLGLTVTRSKLYDDLGVAQPAPDDDVVGPAQQPQGAFGGFPSIGAGMPNLEAAAAARAAFSGYPARDVDNAEALANKAGAAWLEPIFAALRKAADEGLTPAELKKKLDSLTPNTGALADGSIAGLQGGVECASLVNDPAFQTIEQIAAGHEVINAGSSCRAREVSVRA